MLETSCKFISKVSGSNHQRQSLHLLVHFQSTGFQCLLPAGDIPGPVT